MGFKRLTLRLAIVLSALSAFAALPAASQEKRWNEPDLMPMVNTLGAGGQGRFDTLDSLRQFELLQASLEKLKLMVLAQSDNELEASEGLRGILKVMGMEITDAIYSDFKNPLFARLDTRHREVGAFNPDAEYDQTRISGEYDYKVTGNLGAVPYVSITINGTSPTQRSTIVGYMDDAQIRDLADAEGNFTIWLSKEKPTQPGGWIPITKETSGFVGRQYIGDRSRQKMATFALTAVGDTVPDTSRMPDQEIGFRINRVANALLVNMTWNRTLTPYALKEPNKFFEQSGQAIGGNVANTENLYDMAHFQIADDEALVIDFKPPQTRFWNLTSATWWHESENYLTDPVSLTMDKVVRRKDGTVRMILAHRDPGLPNWLNSFHHNRGFMILRMVRVDHNPVPTITKVKFASLGKFK